MRSKSGNIRGLISLSQGKTGFLNRDILTVAPIFLRNKILKSFPCLTRNLILRFILGSTPVLYRGFREEKKGSRKSLLPIPPFFLHSILDIPATTLLECEYNAT